MGESHVTFTEFVNTNVALRCVQFSPTKYYTLEKAKPDSTKNVLLSKILQFLPNHNETLSKSDTHEVPYFHKVS